MRTIPNFPVTHFPNTAHGRYQVEDVRFMEILWRTTPTQIGILVHRRNTLVSLGANSLLILRARKVLLSDARRRLFSVRATLCIRWHRDGPGSVTLQDGGPSCHSRGDTDRSFFGAASACDQCTHTTGSDLSVGLVGLLNHQSHTRYLNSFSTMYKLYCCFVCSPLRVAPATARAS